MSDKVVKLPERDEIIRRLKAAYDDRDMIERFYPLIAQEGGRGLVAEGIVIMFTQKIHLFVSSGYSQSFIGILHGWVPAFIDAIVDDKEVAEKAKQYHKRAVDAVSKKA